MEPEEVKPEDKFVLLAELDGEYCGLNHGPECDIADFPAVNYITIPCGPKGPENSPIVLNGHVITDNFVVPVCQECINSLYSNEWTLLYCLECNSSQWIYQSLAKLHYFNKETMRHYHIIGMVGCPKCTGKLEGLYFLDS